MTSTPPAHPAAPDPSGRIFLLRRLPWLIVLLQLAWAGYGIWPLGPVEGDDQGVMFGIEAQRQGDPLLRHMRYLYEVQPGSYQVLGALARVTGASGQTVFGLATISGALVFALVGALLLQAVLAWPLGWLLAAMLWCQEVTAAACYANTSAVAGGLALLGVFLSARASGWLWSALALAAAGWLRADSLLVAPGCLGLIYWRQRRWPVTLRRTAVIAVTAGAVLALLYQLSGTSLREGLAAYSLRGYHLGSWRILAENPVQLLSPGLAVAAGAGCLLLLWRRDFARGLVVLSGAAASVAAYGPSLTTPKYFYFLVPFALLPALILGAALLARMRRWPPLLTGLAAGGCLLADGGLGLRTLQPDGRFFTTAPTWAALGEFTRGGKTFGLVVGPGELIPDADGFRLRTGQFFAPLCWHREKQRMQADLATVRAWLDRGRDLTIYWGDWLSTQVIARELLAAGFRPGHAPVAATGLPEQGAWRRGGQSVQVGFLGYAGSIYQPPGPAPASGTGADTYFIGNCARHPITELADDRQWQLVSATPEGFISLHQRR